MYSNRPRRNWGIIAVVSVLGISNLSLMNTLVSHKLKNPFPNINLPVGPYTSYRVVTSEKGYTISYRANDPKILTRVKYRWPTLKEFLTLYFDDEILNGHNIYMQGIDLRGSQAIYETSIFDIWSLYMHPDLYVYIALI